VERAGYKREDTREGVPAGLERPTTDHQTIQEKEASEEKP